MRETGTSFGYCGFLLSYFTKLAARGREGAVGANPVTTRAARAMLRCLCVLRHLFALGDPRLKYLPRGGRSLQSVRYVRGFVAVDYAARRRGQRDRKDADEDSKAA